MVEAVPIVAVALLQAILAQAILAHVEQLMRGTRLSLVLPLLFAAIMVLVHIREVSGNEVASLVVEPHWTAAVVLAQIQFESAKRRKIVAGYEVLYKLLHGNVEAEATVTMAAAGVVDEAELTLVRRRYPLILTASGDKTAKLWGSESGECLKTLEGHEGPVLSAVFSPDGLHVVTASEDGTAKFWSSESGECLKTLQGHGACVHSAVFSPD